MADTGRSNLKSELVLLEKVGRLATITINRAEKLNALSLNLMGEFRQVLEDIAGDDELSVVIITGAGRAFSVGADVEFLHSLGSPKQFRQALKEYWHDNFNAIESMEKLFIAAINGIALGGAIEMALACDLRIAAASATFAMPEIEYGLIPDSGGTNRLARLIGSACAKEFALSGDFISSAEAGRIGLVNQIFPDETFATSVEKYANKFLDKSPRAIGFGKRAINRSMELDTYTALDEAGSLQTILLGSEAYQRAVRLFHEKRTKKPPAGK